MIDVSAYIIAVNKTVKEAEEDPHAIQYLNYKTIDGIPIPHDWIFWEWRHGSGLIKRLGKGSPSNIRFIKTPQGFFDPPADFIKK